MLTPEPSSRRAVEPSSCQVPMADTIRPVKGSMRPPLYVGRFPHFFPYQRELNKVHSWERCVKRTNRRS